MFDQLIESEPEGTQYKNRRSYFIVSSIVVSILIATAVVISIYAADIGLGRRSLELVEMIAAVEPVPETRESPSSAPIGDKLVLATGNPRDCGLRFRDAGGGGPSGLKPTIEEPRDDDIEASPEKKQVASKPPIIVSDGPMNGRATYLPKPVYPATALAVHASGRVDVQITIDESGYVVSATAINGHPMLRSPSVQAAMKARFSPTYISKVPVQVTGMIAYNFYSVK